MSAPSELTSELGVVARASRPGPLPFVLKSKETFAVFNAFGDIHTSDNPEQGVYHNGTRYLSRLALRLWGVRPLLLSATVPDDNSTLVAHLTNPDLDARASISRGVVYLERSTVLGPSSCHQRLRFHNFAAEEITVPLTLLVDADFRDIFEIRGSKRARRGRQLAAVASADTEVFAYEGLHGLTFRTTVQLHPAPDRREDHVFQTELAIPPKAEREIEVACYFSEDEANPPRPRFGEVSALEVDRLRAARRDSCQVRTSNEQFNEWVRRSFVDLHMLTTETDAGLYPYAGIPWFSTPFGRDGIIAAWQCLWVRPALARGVLAFLARNQATETNAKQECQPGKILHEMRYGEMVALGEVPFQRYYGTVDATPLFVCLAGEYFERTGDRDFLAELWPNIRAALDWIDEYGDSSGNGYVEYQRSVHGGLTNQGWKDSDDAIFYADGSDLEGPVALCEVQAYVYGAKRAAARLARALDKADEAHRLDESADALRRQFDADFWCEDLGTYAPAIDADRRPCRIRASNAGHALFGGIATRKHAARVARSLLEPGSFSGWGIRTLDESAIRYNPMSYHNGSVWPHDNAMIAAGFGRYGYKQAAVKVLSALFGASLFMPMHRLPELFCGFARLPDTGPALYPVACMPQAWASGAVFQLLQACLGLRFAVGGADDAPVVEFHRPALPHGIDQIEIQNLCVGEATIDLHLRRYASDVAVNVRRRSGDVRLVVSK